MRYRSARDDDAALREKPRKLANWRRRFGYRRLHILPRREGVIINRKKTQRLYQEEGLAIRRRRSRRRAVGTKAPARVLALPNQRWSLDPSTSSGKPLLGTRWRQEDGSACSTLSTM